MKINKYQNGDTIQGDKYRREGVQALQYQEAEKARRHAEWLSRLEMRPVVVKKATLKEKMQGKKDETKLVPHVVGMSGADPIGEFVVSGIGLGKAMEGAYLVGKYAFNQGRKAILSRAIDKAVSKGILKEVPKPVTKSDIISKSVVNKSEGLWTDWAQDMLNDPDKLSKFIDELKGTLAGLKMDNLKYPGFFDSHIAKVTLEIENLENIYRQISTAPVVKDLRKVLNDFYPQLTNNKYTTLTPGPYTERNVAGELIYPIGTIKPGAYADYRMEKMMDLLRERGIQPSESGFWKVTEGGPKAVGTIGGQVRELTHKPATLYTTRHSTNVQGFEVPSTGKSYVRVRSNSNMDEVHSTNTHEVIGHGTEIFINDVTKGAAMNEYKAVTDLVKAHGKFKTADSIKPGELRSTLLEVHNALVNEVKRFVHGSVKQTEAIIKDRVGKMSVQEFMKRLEGTNSYGKDYAAFIADNPQTVNLFKKLLTDGLSVAAPVGLTGYGFADWLKKGGKTHKPFGHRSILDNGWQSTKLLKNKKNVYGKSKS